MPSFNLQAVYTYSMHFARACPNARGMLEPVQARKRKGPNPPTNRGDCRTALPCARSGSSTAAETIAGLYVRPGSGPSPPTRLVTALAQIKLYAQNPEAFPFGDRRLTISNSQTQHHLTIHHHSCLVLSCPQNRRPFTLGPFGPAHHHALVFISKSSAAALEPI